MEITQELLAEIQKEIIAIEEKYGIVLRPVHKLELSVFPKDEGKEEVNQVVEEAVSAPEVEETKE